MSDPATIWLQSLKDIIQAYIDNFQKTLGFLLLTSGWLVTSDTARAFVKSSNLTFVVVVVVILLVLVVHISASFYYRDMSRKKQIILSNQNVPESYYDHLVISPQVIWMNIIVNTLLFITLLTLVIATKFAV